MYAPRVHVPRALRSEVSPDRLGEFVAEIGTFLEGATGGVADVRQVFVLPGADGDIAGVYTGSVKVKFGSRRRAVPPKSIVIGWNSALALGRLEQGCILPGYGPGDAPLGNVRNSHSRLRTLVHEILHSIGDSTADVGDNRSEAYWAGLQVWNEGLTEAATHLLIKPLIRQLRLDSADTRLIEVHESGFRTGYIGYVSAVRRVACAAALAGGTTMEAAVLRAVAHGDGEMALKRMVITTKRARGHGEITGADACVGAMLEAIAPLRKSLADVLAAKHAGLAMPTATERRSEGATAGRQAVAVLGETSLS